MKLLLLIFSILWSVHSVRQFKLNYEKCADEYFCTVAPDVAKKDATPSAKHLVPLGNKGLQTIPEVGVIIKPLSTNKWLLIMHVGKDVSISQGIHLAIAHKSTTNHDENKNEIVAGCNEQGTVKGKLAAAGFDFDVMLEDSEFVDKGKIVCVGILTASNIASLLGTAQTNMKEVRLLYTMYIEVNGATNPFPSIRTLATRMEATDRTVTYEKFDFDAVNKIMGCDFSLLKPPQTALTYSHDSVAVETISNSIDCTPAHLFSPSDTALDLLIRPKGTDFAVKADSITCAAKKLRYSVDSRYEDIVDEAEVACGKRKKCTVPKPVNQCDNKICSQEKLDKQVCNPNKDQCEKIECPRDRWIINDETMYHGQIECRKESVEDFSKIYWFATIGKKKVRMDQGSCYKKIDCQWNRPITTKCPESKVKCREAEITSTRVYCPKTYDMIYVDKESKKELIADNFRCNEETGDWNQNEVADKLDSVFCLFNVSKRNIILGGEAVVFVAEDTEELSWKDYCMIGAMGALLILFITVFLVMIFKRRYRRNKRLADEAKRKDKKLWNKDDRYKLRPFNKMNAVDEFRLGYKDLKLKGRKDICEGMHLDFNLYSPEERTVYLEKLLIDFGTGAELIKMVIPLLGKCTENDQDYHAEYQPLHPSTTRVGFRILKMLCGCFGHRGDTENEKRIRKAIGMRGKNITFKLQMERSHIETDDVTQVRIAAIEALLFAGEEVTVAWLLRIFRSVSDAQKADTPLRKFVYAAGVKWGDNQFDNVKKLFDEELARVKTGTQQPDDTRWGTRLDHFIYALCAADRPQAESFLNYLIKDPFFTAKHIMIGFQAMLEVFDDNQVAARFLFIERHNFLKQKIDLTSPEYLQLWRWMYTYIIFFPGNELWLWRHLCTEGYYTEAEKKGLDFATATTYGGIYSVVYKWKDVADTIEWELMDKEYVKETEMKPETESEKSLDWYDPDNPRDIAKKKKKEEDRIKRAEESERAREKRAEKRRQERAEMLEKHAMDTARELQPGDVPVVEKAASLKEQTAIDDGSGPLEKTQSDKSSPLEKTQQSDKPSLKQENPGSAK